MLGYDTSHVAKRYDVAIIGAGVFGAWTAFHLVNRGARVLIVDQHAPANSRASSGGETRVIRMSYGADEVYTRSSIRSLALWKQFFPSMFHKTGVVVTAAARDPYLVATRDTLARCGYEFDWAEVSELRRRFPQIRFPRGSAAVYEPDSGVLMARRGVQAVVEAAVQAGARYETRRISEPDRKLAEMFVFACGPWLPKIFPDVIGPRIRPTRQEVFFYGADRAIAASLRCRSGSRSGKACIRSRRSTGAGSRLPSTNMARRSILKPATAVRRIR